MAGLVETVDWANVTVAAAFVLGAIVGTVATILVMRLAITFLKDQGKS